jgi:hypothetical protein
LALSGASAAQAQQTPHLQFVTEYVRELSQIEELRQRAADNIANDPQHGFANCIADMTSLQMEYQSQIEAMKGITLSPPVSELPGEIAAFYQMKVNLYGQFIDACSAMMSGPKPGVDYSAIAANLPKIRAQLDYVDRSLFDASPLIFATLIDRRADSAGHVSHLVISNAERTELLRQMDTEFGGKLDDAMHAGYVVQSAGIIKGYLQKDFKGSDDPW